MKIPAIRGFVGDWVYYTTNLTFEQISTNVSRIDDELHKAKSLNELIQRSITNNYKGIRDYILNQPEVFFNALVLAAYDSYPDWIEVELKYDNEETFKVGLLDFPDKHKIFPIDGQHRVEGIKAALQENPELRNMQIPAIFVGHKNDEEGLKRTRRLFSTLNRYAKPVLMDDIIALDEDDSIAIITRDLIENHLLFAGDRISKTHNKAIPNDDKQAFTSIITLYECNRELLRFFRLHQKTTDPDPERDAVKFQDYLKYRPSDEELNSYRKFCFDFWNALTENNSSISDYLMKEISDDQSAIQYRNSDTGGNLLFRPIGLLPFVKAVYRVKQTSEKSIAEIIKDFESQNLILNAKPWKRLIWDDTSKTMIMANKTIIELVLLLKYDIDLLKVSEIQKIKNKYITVLNLEGQETNEVLEHI
ncbi:DNA sulfur modification protein DndB [Chryseobacterium caseinilyticum]|uniref:DGQHR domain-containing protein n=1 Tax=Chryseobacterium caseinilyticum TaxID=2771428 RepID=A0ABR8ZCI2_9FLAO|nr:DNA sulfur modification protein DndB [Chryseobacterium caseinilyticum]MBD8083015.1 DGQHR domain-containing protein [Chryseobacterium caseinilyticum]